jgi:hypothetical protein
MYTIEITDVCQKIKIVETADSHTDLCCSWNISKSNLEQTFVNLNKSGRRLLFITGEAKGHSCYRTGFGNYLVSCLL